MESQTLTERFGPFTVSVAVRDLVRTGVMQALAEDTPIVLASTRRSSVPQIGEYWPEQHGICGGRYVDELDRLYALIVSRRSEGEIARCGWVESGERAAALSIGGLTDWTLFSRIEGIGCSERLQPKLKGTDDAFPEEWHWTSQRYGSDDAWVQYFNNGNSIWISQSYGNLARAVRRVILQ